jgi:hypothetical protein
MIRWPIATALDHYSDTCWYELATWALFPTQSKFGKIWYMRHTRGQCARMDDAYNYCGKCDVLGG